MTASKVELLQGTLDMLILRIVARGPIHGYAIAQEIHRISRDVLHVRQGSLYPALHKLERKKWLRAAWRVTETGRDAKYYRLTTRGGKQLDAEQANWNRLIEAMTMVLQEAE